MKKRLIHSPDLHSAEPVRNHRYASHVPDAQLLTADEAAARLNVSKKTLYRLVARRAIEVHRFMRRLRFSADNLATFADDTKVERRR